MKTNKEILKNEDERKDRNRSSYSELPEDDEQSPAKNNKKEHSKSTKEGKEWGLRRKSNKEKNDPERFSGEGVNFKGKIIGIEGVFDARGNRMCQDALQKLKAAVKLSGEHKQRIILNISLCGIRIKDEKTGEVLHHHPVHKISFISQDVGDSRAFGYVFGCPQTGHQFFGIKTEKTAAQIVCTLRDLFHTALEIKKKEIERAMELQNEAEESNESSKQQNGLKQENGSPNTPNSPEELKTPNEELPISKNSEPIYSDIASPNESNETTPPFHSTPVEETQENCSAVDNLLDLQFEMDNLQQGITQMNSSIASVASFGVSFSEDDNSVCSGNSQAVTPRKYNRFSSLHHETLSVSSRSSSTSDYAVYTQDIKTEESEACIKNGTSSSDFSSVSEIPTKPDPVEDKYAVFYDIDSLPSVFDNPSFVSSESKDGIASEDSSKSDEENRELLNSELDNTDTVKSPLKVFAELDPLGNHPYVDKEKFFHEIKNPPKKVLKELAGDSLDSNTSIVESEMSTAVLLNGSTEFIYQDKPYNPFIGVSSTPPKLPPKRAFSVTSPLPFSCRNDMLNSVVENSALTSKNPFNPFNSSSNNDDFPDIPPPSSPPPPPPRLPTKDLDNAISSPVFTRLPAKDVESFHCTSPLPRLPVKDTDPCQNMSPPARPPSRTSGAPTPPLPRRKTLSSTSNMWFSFDQEALVGLPATQSTFGDNLPPYSPPIPAPSRKLPPINKCDSPAHRTCSASSSPASSRKHLNHATLNSSAKDLSVYQTVTNGNISPGRKLTRHSSVTQEPWSEKNTDVAFSTNIVRNPFVAPVSSSKIKNEIETKRVLNNSPPVPPKSSTISRPRPSPTKKMLSVSSNTSKSCSNSSSFDGKSDASSSSLRYSSLEESLNSTGSEALRLKSTSSPSDVFFSGHNGEITGETKSPENILQDKLSPTSPDSIFRRKSDPFADDFFLSLPKKSECTANKNKEITENTNGFEADFENSKLPVYSQVNKSAKDS